MAILEPPHLVSFDAIRDKKNANFIQILKQLSYPKTGAFIKVEGQSTPNEVELVRMLLPRAFSGTANNGRALNAEGSSIIHAFELHLPSIKHVQNRKEIVPLLKTMLGYYGKHLRIFDRYLLDMEIKDKNYSFLRAFLEMLVELPQSPPWEVDLWICKFDRNPDPSFETITYIESAKKQLCSLVKEQFIMGFPRECSLKLFIDKSMRIHSRMVLSPQVGIGLSHSFQEGGEAELYLMPDQSLRDYWKLIDELNNRNPPLLVFPQI